MRTIILIALFFLLSNSALCFPARVVKNVAYGAKRESKALYEEVKVKFNDSQKQHQTIRLRCEKFMNASSDYYRFAPSAYRDGAEKIREDHLERLNIVANQAFDALKEVGYESPAFIRSEGSMKALNDLIHAFKKPNKSEGKKS